jgi:glycosyltransferase involved in cell wall biosynthesis
LLAASILGRAFQICLQPSTRSTGKTLAQDYIIVGDGPYLDTYIDLVRSMECRCAVTFMGAQDDPLPFLLSADVFVLPSHADPAPLVLSEAREAGCAIVATDVDGIPELLEQGIEHLRIERVAQETLEVYATASRQVHGQSSERV